MTCASKAEDVRCDLVQAIELLANSGVLPIVSTIPPQVGKPELGRAVSAAIRAVAKEKQLPLIDYEQEILTRRPDDWDGTLMNKVDVHPSASHAGTTPSSAPTSRTPMRVNPERQSSHPGLAERTLSRNMAALRSN